MKELFDGSVFFEIQGKWESGNHGWNNGSGVGGDGFVGGKKLAFRL
jgi:peroxygenase